MVWSAIMLVNVANPGKLSTNPNVFYLQRPRPVNFVGHHVSKQEAYLVEECEN